MIQIPQVTGVLKNVALILVMGPVGGVALAYMGGELHSWSDFPVVLNHGLFMSVGLAAGWLFFRSPWASIYQSLVQQDTKTITKPSGETATVKTETKTTVEMTPPVPPVEPGKGP